MDDKSTFSAIKEQNRSQAHPTSDLPDIILFVTKIHTDLGYTSYHDKNAIAKVYGLAYDTIKQRLSTAVQYGLLELRHGTGYKVTPLFHKLYRPENDFEKKDAALESLRNPELYAKLIAEYDGHNLPSQVGLSTTLFRRYGLNEKSAEKAAEIFLQNLRHFDLIINDNILNFSNSIKSKSEETQLDGGVIITNNTTNDLQMLPYAEVVTPNTFIEIPVPMKDGKKAYVKIPESATSEDYQRIARVIEAYK